MLENILSNLHEKSRAQGFSDVDVVVFRVEVCRSPLEVESVHDPTELLPDVIGRLETPVVDKVVVTPLGILHVLREGVVHVQKGQVITVDVRKPGNLKKIIQNNTKIILYSNHPIVACHVLLTSILSRQRLS